MSYNRQSFTTSQWATLLAAIPSEAIPGHRRVNIPPIGPLYLALEWDLEKQQDFVCSQLNEHLEHEHSVEQQNQQLLAKYPELKTEYRIMKRRLQAPRLELLMETREDVQLRLASSIVFIYGEPFFVRDSFKVSPDIWLLLEDVKGNRTRIRSNDPAIELRSPEPQYINLNNSPYFFFRMATREQKQGISNQNSRLQIINSGGECTTWHTWTDFARSWDHKELVWKDEYADLMVGNRAVGSLRLSKNICMYVDKAGELMAEYRGRPLGVVEGRKVIVDPLDYKRPWIAKEIQNIGCEVGHG